MHRTGLRAEINVKGTSGNWCRSAAGKDNQLKADACVDLGQIYAVIVSAMYGDLCENCVFVDCFFARARECVCVLGRVCTLHSNK